MEEDRTLQILFVNTFFLLNNVAQLNLPRFLRDLSNIREAMENYNNKTPPLPQLLSIAISSLVVAKFFINYINLAAHVIATFPIVQEENMKLLLPTILFQAVDRILLNCIEIILSFITVRYWTHKYSLFLVLFVKVGIKMAFSFYILNIYAEYFQSMAILSEVSGALTYGLFTVWNELPLKQHTEDQISPG